jgi:hypothetical protein
MVPSSLGGQLANQVDACRRIGPSKKMRQRVDAVLELDPPTEQLPSLGSLLAASPADFRRMLEKVQSGEYRSNTSTKHRERGIRVQHPGLWEQL